MGSHLESLNFFGNASDLFAQGADSSLQGLVLRHPVLQTLLRVARRRSAQPPKRSLIAVRPVHVRGISLIDPLGGPAHMPLRALNLEVVVIAHQTVAVEDESPSCVGLRQYRQEGPSVYLAEEDILLSHSPGSDVVVGPRHLDTYRSSHDAFPWR